MIIAHSKMEWLQCDFNLFLVYSSFRPAYDNRETNDEINEPIAICLAWAGIYGRHHNLRHNILRHRCHKSIWETANFKNRKYTDDSTFERHIEKWKIILQHFAVLWREKNSDAGTEHVLKPNYISWTFKADKYTFRRRSMKHVKRHI